ncbi:hypothetical protein CC79DRAFT_156723 [Sarocladium strictum]
MPTSAQSLTFKIQSHTTSTITIMIILRIAPRRSFRAARCLASTHLQTRSLHQTHRLCSQPKAELPLPNPRWVSNLYGKLQSPKRDTASKKDELLEEVRSSALGLMLGVEGFGNEPFHVEPVTWGDMDAMGMYHSAGASDVAASAPKEHRRLFENMMNPKGFGLILQEITTTYKFPLKYPDTVLVAHKLSEPLTKDSKSMTLEAVIISKRHLRIAARLVEKISFYDYVAGKVALVPPPLLEQLNGRSADLLRIQQESRQKVQELEQRVEQLT